ncbi:hypothetical protein Syun_000974 [Stephania yunnanensis]|uniref:Uncharacterized protein n=1 Tax=Stephania yunnanensis TaxID=152371 RepID=A0AAP0Q7A4_9MAGN
MVKVRMNTADVAAEVKCLRRLIEMRCSNVYDLSPKTYMFKLMNSSGVTDSGESEKVLLLMESGVRLHTTAYARSPIPPTLPLFFISNSPLHVCVSDSPFVVYSEFYAVGVHAEIEEAHTNEMRNV